MPFPSQLRLVIQIIVRWALQSVKCRDKHHTSWKYHRMCTEWLWHEKDETVLFFLAIVIESILLQEKKSWQTYHKTIG